MSDELEVEDTVDDPAPESTEPVVDDPPDTVDDPPDTVDDPPDSADDPPDTVDDPPDTVDDPTSDSTPRKGGRSRLWIVSSLLCLLLGSAGAYVYFAFWRYTPTALHHVPSGANILIRADAAKLVLFKPVRVHILPLLFGRRPNVLADRSRRTARIAEETGVDVSTDLRELVVASVDGISWVAIAGGNIEPGRFVDGLQRVLEEEGIDSWSKDGDLLVSRYGAVLAQAEDGTLIVGSARDIVEAALPQSEDAEELPMSTEAAVTFRVSHLAFKRALGAMPASIPAEPLHAVDELSGAVTLGDTPTLSLDVLPKSTTTPAQLSTDLGAMFSKMSLALLLVPHDLYGAKSAISNASVTATPDTVRIHTEWPYEPLDQAVRLLAKALRGSKPQPQKP